MALHGNRFCVDTVAIIGGGPCGIAAAKYLLAEKCYYKVKIFEQRASVGGIWNYSGRVDSEVQDKSGNESHDDPSFVISPIYDGLESNIPLSIMQFSDYPFPKGTPLLPDWQTILEYLKDYARDTENIIDFQQKVLDFRPDPQKGSEKWILTSQDLQTQDKLQEVYDAVVVF